MPPRALVITVLLLGTAFGVRPAAATDPATDPDNLDRRLAVLEARVERLLEPRDDAWLDARRAAEIRSLTEDILADADRRVARLARRDDDGPQYDGGFVIAGRDGAFTLEIGGQVQLRYVVNRRSRAPDDGTLAGLENRRTKLSFGGHFGDLTYAVRLAFDDDDGAGAVEGPYLEHPLGRGWRIRVGKFRTPLLREYSISSRRQLLAERSLVARRFRQDRTAGARVEYRAGGMRIRAGLMDASGRLFDDQDLLTSARIELLLKGEVRGLRDFTSLPDAEPLVALGAGILYQDTDRISPTAADENLVRWSVDLTVETGGTNMMAAFVGNHTDVEGEENANQYGLVLQGGVFIDEQWEVFAQYAWGDADGTIPDLSVITVGVTRYMLGHDLKWTFDVGYGLNEVAGFWASSGAGWRRDRRGEGGQVVMRGQLLLAF